ncbi:MAG: aminodeoxychorismate/anthranilate synthase component II [Lachnospiraceae bacterium]|nr:aminodeoxychorismate/anthranilate synthase component II [Lachnospiraceae bacterium]
MILLIDNYDSFSYNLYQMMGEINPDITVIRNDEKSIAEIEEMKPDKIVISPGPGRPEDAGNIIEVIQKLGDHIPILGVCLGMQAICMAHGAEITYAPKLYHGKQSEVTLDTDCSLFKECSKKTKVARYHSLVANEKTIPEELAITAKADTGEVMAVKHATKPIYGVQFHPESIMTDEGRKMLANFIDL